MPDETLPGAVTHPLLARREFLKVSSAGLGCLVVGLSVSLGGSLASAAPVSAPFEPNCFIRIEPSGQVVVIMPAIEMGQGIYTGLAMLVAEELEVELDRVRPEHAPPNEALYANAINHEQLTGDSTSMRAWWEPLRRAAAVVRTLLIRAAARQWRVDPSSCWAKRGEVHHPATGRTRMYAELLDAASVLPVPSPHSVDLKDPKQFKLIGTSVKRLDAPDKVTGKCMFGIDARPPGFKVAAIATSPVTGGRLATLDEEAALGIKGVLQVVRLPEADAVAVVADHTGAAVKGLAALAITWHDGPNAKVNTAEIVRHLATASKNAGAVARNEGNVAAAMASAARKVNATYEMPFLAHTPMEPLNCTVHVRTGACDIWVGTQVPVRVQAAAARLTGLPPERIAVHNTYVGGGFGRKTEVDYVEQAIQVARQVSFPVKVIWSREEDIQHDMFRPYYYDRLSAGLDSSGKPVAWQHRITGASVLGRLAPESLVTAGGVDADAVECASHPIYEFPAIHVDYVRYDSPAVRTTWWRGVGAGHNIFMIESFIDELAAAAKQDPVAYRKQLLGKTPRAQAVLELAAEKSDWGAKLPPRRGRGVSVQFAFGSYVAQVAEVSVGPDGKVVVHRVVTAVDCGQVINPGSVEGQIQGGLIYGLSAALHGAITLSNGRVEQSNFDNYPALRIGETPQMEVHLIKSTEAPGGISEAGTAAVVPAVVNAVYAATGKRLRKLPIDATQLKTS